MHESSSSSIYIILQKLYLFQVNAVYFKAKWLSQFNPNNTQYLPFHVNSKTSKVTRMMMKTDDFFAGNWFAMHFCIRFYSSSRYAKHVTDFSFPVVTEHLASNKVRLLRLPYEGKRQAMFILLPDNDLDSMLESMHYNDIRLITESNILAKTSYRKVIIPKFEQRIELNLRTVSAFKLIFIIKTFIFSI